MHPQTPMKTSPILLCLLALVTSAPAAVIGINFGADAEATPADAYTTHNLSNNTTVTSWVNFTGDWSGNSTTFQANGASVQIYYDSSNVWSNGNVSATSVNRGYLDDWNYNAGGGSNGLNAGATIMLGGLNAWLAATGMTSYQVVVLRSTDSDNATFTDIRWGSQADDAGGALPGGWMVDPATAGAWPIVGDFTGGNILDGDQFLDQALRIGESAALTGTLDNLVLQGGHINGSVRGSISGIVIIGVPEPGTAGLALSAAGMLLARRRRR